MDLSQLKDYLDTIIVALNQHAKLIKTLNKEMMGRTTEKQMADLFVLISAGLPYESLVKKIGGVPPARRGSIVKLLGDSSLIPNNVGLTIIGSSGATNQVKGEGFPQNTQSQHVQLLESAEKFLKTTEMIGKYLLDYKEFTHYMDGHITRIDNDVSMRLTKAEYVSNDKAKRKKLKNRISTSLSGFEERIRKLESSFVEEMSAFKRKQEEIELNTYWKIDDYKKLLMSRISETHMKDYVQEEVTRLNNTIRDIIDRKADDLSKSVKILEQDEQTSKHGIHDKLESIKRQLEAQSQM